MSQSSESGSGEGDLSRFGGLPSSKPWPQARGNPRDRNNPKALEAALDSSQQPLLRELPSTPVIAASTAEGTPSTNDVSDSDTG